MSSTEVKKGKWIMTNKYEMKERLANSDEVSYMHKSTDALS